MEKTGKIFLVCSFIWEEVLVFAAYPVLMGSHTTETALDF